MNYFVLTACVLSVIQMSLLHGMEGQPTTTSTNAPRLITLPCVVTAEGSVDIKVIEGVSGTRYTLPLLNKPKFDHAKPRTTIVVEGTLSPGFAGPKEELALQCMRHILAELYQKFDKDLLNIQQCELIIVYTHCPDIQSGKEIIKKLNAMFNDIFPGIQEPFYIFLPARDDAAPVTLQATFIYEQ